MEISHHNTENADSSNRPDSVYRSLIVSYNRPDSALRAVVFVVGFASVYLLLNIPKARDVFPVALLLFGALELVRLIGKYKDATMLEVWCEASFCLVLLGTFYGVYRSSFAFDRTFMFATAFYRPYKPYFTMQYNRRVALGLCCVITTIVLPVVLGIVKEPTLVSLLGTAYIIVVASLWAFCSDFALKYWEKM